MEFKVGDYFEFNTKKFTNEFTPYSITCGDGLFRVVSKNRIDISHLYQMNPLDLYNYILRNDSIEDCRVETIIPPKSYASSEVVGKTYGVSSVYFTKIQDFRANHRIRKYLKEVENGN